MREDMLITRSSNLEKAQARLSKGEINFKHSDLCGVSEKIGASKGGDDAFGKMKGAKSLKASMPNFDEIRKYGSAFDIPVACDSKTGTDGKPVIMSVREMVKAGVFSKDRFGAKGSSNTLLSDWDKLWNMVRIDLSIKKALYPTIRENIYRTIDMPNSDKVFRVDEFFPYAITFAEHNGKGEAVRQGETRGGQTDTVEHFIYAAGFTFDLISALFDKSLDIDKVNDAVMEGYNGKRDDLAIAPILAGTYASTKTTASATTSGATREELLYYTLENALDAFAKKTDPITKQKIGANNLVVLASEYNAAHIARIASGMIKKASVMTDAGFPALSEIKQILGYDDKVITGRTESITYGGVGDTYAYLIMPCNGATKNRYMNIGVKRNLTAEVDMQPDVKTLAQEERAWYFVEGMTYAEGINSFIQRVTLPAW